MEQLSWMLFLKIFEGMEEENEEIEKMKGEQYIPIIDKKYRWSNWDRRDWIGKLKENLLKLIENKRDINKIDMYNSEFKGSYFITSTVT